jgi:hypothetical protein
MRLPPRRPIFGHLFRVLNLPVLPLTLTKRAVSKTLAFIEHHHLPERSVWVYDQLTARGIQPLLSGIGEGGGVGAGLAYERALFSAGTSGPALRGRVETFGTLLGYQQHSARLRLAELAGGRLTLEGSAQYQDRTQEDFFGLGPATSEGRSLTYGQEEVALAVGLEHQALDTVRWQGRVGFRHVDIDEGRDEGKPHLIRAFTEATLPGTDGAELLSVELGLGHETRDAPEDPARGGYERFGLAYVEGVGGSDVGFFRYHVEAARFIPLGSEERVLALRAVAEHHDELNRRPIPFFELARLGGGRSLRGFQRNRFFDESAVVVTAEYRYTVWRYKAYALDTALFFDGGNVFEEISAYELDEFRPSYGAGVRVKAGRRVLASFDVGHSDDGTEVFLRYGLPF